MSEYTIKSNPVKETREELDAAIKNNEGYCPCLSEKNEDTKCMCKKFREQDTNGFCHCGRFIKLKKIKRATILSDDTPSAIERALILQEILFKNGVCAEFFLSTDIVEKFYAYRNNINDLYYNSIMNADSVFYVGESINDWAEEVLMFAEECGHEIKHMGMIDNETI